MLGYRSVLTDSFGRRYEQDRDFWTAENALRGVVRSLLAALGDRPSHVLDVGTGRGPDAQVLLAAGHAVTGLDLIATAEWAELERRYPDRARFVEADLHEAVSATPEAVSAAPEAVSAAPEAVSAAPEAVSAAPEAVSAAPEAVSALGANRFDAVLDNGCLHHQPPAKYASVLAGYRKMLRPDGILVLSLFGILAEHGVLHNEDDGRLSREFTESEARQLVTDVGFDLLAVEVVARARPERKYLVLTARPC